MEERCDLWKMSLDDPRKFSKEEPLFEVTEVNRIFCFLMHANKKSSNRLHMKFGMPSRTYLGKLGKVDIAFTDLSA